MDIYIRLYAEDVCTALRAHLEQRGLRIPEGPDAFEFSLDPNTNKLVVEVRSVSTGAPAPVSTPALEHAFAQLVQEIETPQVQETAQSTTPVSDFSDEATEASIEKMFQGTGQKPKKPIDSRPAHERFKHTTAYPSLEAAGKEDGDIADEIA